MKVYDTSSLIDIWDYYLPSSGLFPEFWVWQLDAFQSERSVIPEAAFKELEVERKEFAELLLAKGVKFIATNDEIRELAVAIQEAMGVGPEGFSPKGVSTADFKIIATAKILRAEVVSEEKQPNDPDAARNSKVPTVCRKPFVKVKCTNIRDVLVEYAASLRK